MKTFFINKTLFLSIALLLISLGCKKYTKNQVNYIITLESNTPFEKVSYALKKSDEDIHIFVAPEPGSDLGEFAAVNDYKFILDTTLITDKFSFIDIRYSFDLPSGVYVDALINATMIRTETNEVLFQRGFHKDDESGSFRIYL